MIYFKNLTKRIVLIATLLCINKLTAQIGGGGDAFIQGTSVQIGVELSGGYEGANTPPPVTGVPWRFRGAVGLSGFVADPLVSSWLNYNGDFYTPGSPENGWGVLIGSTGGGLQLHCNRNGSLNDFGIGNTIAYQNSGVAKTICWSGAAISGTNNITANITYSLGINNLYYTTTVKFTNNSAATIPEMYYYRSLDPDNNQSISGSFVTTNSIVSQPSGVGSCGIAAVQATQLASGLSGASYMALAGVGVDFRVCKGGFSNRNAFNIWNSVAPLNGVPGTVSTADEAISLAYKIQTFLPGTSRFFSFVTILRSTDINLALNSLMTISYPGASAAGGSACTPGVSDTAKICGPTLIEIAGVGSTNYSWSWNPPIGLSSSTTYSTIASPTVLTSYTITGTPIPGPCAPGAPTIYTIVVQPFTPTVITTPSITVCIGSPILLTASGSPLSSYGWVGPSGFSSAAQNPTIAVSTLGSSGTYTVTKALTCVVALTTVLVTPPPTLTLTSSSNTVCTGVSTTLTANSTSGSYNWTPAASLSSSITPVVVSSPTANTTYTVIVGAGTCTNSAVTSVSVVPTPTLTVSSATICAGSTATLTSSGATSYTWSSGSTTNTATFTPPATTVYSVTGANGGVCSVVNSGTVTVIDYPVVNSSSITNLACNSISTGSIVLNATGATGYNWTPNVSTSSTASGLAAGFYTCELSIAPSCSIVTTYTVTEPTALVGVTSLSNTTCGNCNGMALVLATGGTGLYQYNWQPGSSIQSGIVGVCPAIYTVNVTDANNCMSTYTVDILPSPLFTATLAASKLEMYQDESITLTGLTGVSYTWTPSYSALDCYTCSIVNANPIVDMRYCVDIITTDGCQDSACVDIVILCGDVFIPNAFSPNNDGHNDDLGIYGNCINEAIFRVFDRWGELVFETRDIEARWDGKYKGYPVSAGVFVYQLTAKLKNGDKVTKTGNITVVR